MSEWALFIFCFLAVFFMNISVAAISFYKSVKGKGHRRAGDR